ncbi:phospholipase B1, membrane-associated-like, partial [Teleopsis dalmanni]
MISKDLKHISILCLFTSVLLLSTTSISAQRTSLDNAFGQLYRPFRLLALQIIGRSSEDPQNRQRIRSLEKEQKIYSKRTRSLDSFCDTNGPGRRSDTAPTSVHRLRPGDIDVIGAMGDSLTAGNGIYGTNLLQVTVENRGMVWSIGGQGTWREYLTLPNILKEFNPNLYGYSLRDGLSTDRSSKFNVAELGAMSRDIPYEAKILVKRMQRDPLVNMTDHWKMITLLIGNNDFCTDMCYYSNPQVVIKQHERNMLKAYRYLRDTVPRLILNIVPPPNLRLLTKLSGLPQHCQTTLRFECPCLFGKSKSHLDYYEKIMKDWIAK